MNMGIYVPSCDRHRDIGWGVARFASPELRARMVYVVPEGQEAEYGAALARADRDYPGTRLANVVGCPEKGIARTRLWIGRHAQQRGEDRFLMLDDDVWFYTRTTHDPKDAHLEYSKPEQVNAMILGVSQALEHYAHVGISAREGNNRLDQQVKVSDWTVTAKECTRTLRALAYQTSEFLACEHGRVEVMEDFDVNLQLLERGLPNLNIAHWAQGQRQTNAPGGCSGYRSHEVQDQSARRLAELHPGLVALRQKNNKSGGEFGQRTEVTIYWQKAYRQGLARRGA